MKKWIILSIVLVAIIILWQAISIYQTAMSPVKDEMERATEIAKQDAGLITVEEASTYNGTQSYIIVQGINGENEKMVAWVNEENEIVHLTKAEDGVPKEDVLNYLQTDREPKEIISITLAMEKNTPLWEIKFKDNNDQYNLHYIKYDNGEYFQRIIF
ncbi:DUF5590 domain-containing protein [Sutcliffiella horikoshii]|uniref:cell wall elongation regulator TseB-like domain-containing protein n=1 Tax=Sutcliffiella horikoshii TaxID=79883 RepID=UPI00203B5D75|nr:DUF5590 domain-containing protein [Sutcliffiella horikoshii]MCM3617334.1 DUF5590 domain-containing protein [Sutcliffiella horikoshii]